VREYVGPSSVCASGDCGIGRIAPVRFIKRVYWLRAAKTSRGPRHEEVAGSERRKDGETARGRLGRETPAGLSARIAKGADVGNWSRGRVRNVQMIRRNARVRRAQEFAKGIKARRDRLDQRWWYRGILY